MKPLKKHIIFTISTILLILLNSILPDKVSSVLSTFFAIMVIIRYGMKGGLAFTLVISTVILRNFYFAPAGQSFLPIMGIITYVSISIGIGYPIDLMKKEQKNRIAGEERLSRITNNLQDVIIQINRNGIIQYISPSCSKVFGQDPEYYIGRSFYSEIHPEERKDVFEKIEMAFSRKDLELIQYRYSEEYGNYIWVESLGQVIAPYVTFFGLIAALFTGHRIKFEGKEFELGKVNEMMDKVAESVDSAKKKMAEDSISHE